MNTLKSEFGIDIKKATSLDGDINYTNKKFKLKDHSGTKYILKIFPDQEEWLIAKEESIILDQIADKLSFDVPKNIKNLEGNIFFIFFEL
jgi:hypothetical protein